jgi:hypothetical protein
MICVTSATVEEFQPSPRASFCHIGCVLTPVYVQRSFLVQEEMAEIHRRNEEEKKRVMKQAQEDMKALIDQSARTAQERAELQAALDREAGDRRKLHEQKVQLNEKLKVRCPSVLLVRALNTIRPGLC